MAVTKNALVSNADTSTLNPVNQVGVHPKKVVIVHEVGAISNNDVVLLARIPVAAKITSLKIAADDMGTTGTLNFGFYKADGTTISADTDAVDEDALVTALDVNAAAVALTENRFEVKGIETINQKAWELAGLSAAPAYADFYLAATAAAAVDVGGTLVVIVEYLA